MQRTPVDDGLISHSLAEHGQGALVVCVFGVE